MLKRSFTTLALVGASACAAEPQPVGACLYPGEPRCIDFFFEERPGLRADQLCEMVLGGTWNIDVQCPNSGRVGRCTGYGGDGAALFRFAYYSPFTTIDARGFCTGEGFVFEEN